MAENYCQSSSTESGMSYDEAKCQLPNTQWQCPVTTCQKLLSTKYKLRNHVSRYHTLTEKMIHPLDCVQPEDIHYIPEYDEETCKLGDKIWKCPVRQCSRILSTRYTLRKHILSFHRIQGGPSPPRHYKQYDPDNHHNIPKRTRRWQKAKKKSTEDYSGEAVISPLTMDDASSTGSHELIAVFQTSGSGLNDDDPGSPRHAAASSNLDAETHSSSESDEHFEINDVGSVNPALIDEDTLSYIAPSGISISNSGGSDSDMDLESDAGSVAGGSSINSAAVSDENTEIEDCSDPPIYVIPASDEVFKCSLTHSEHSLVIGAYCARHNMTDVAIKDFLGMVQLFLPKDNIVGTNINALKDECGFSSDFLKYNYYCDFCKKLFSENENMCQTPNCRGKKTDLTSKKYFVTTDMKKQIRDVLESDSTWDAIQYSQSASIQSDVINDIRDGKRYKDLLKEREFLHKNNNITLTMFTDGVPLFSSSGVQMWPVYLIINELPPKERFMRKNMILWGIWQGKGKPNMNMFLRCLVEDLIDLFYNGVHVLYKGDSYLVKAMLIVITMDLQARAYMTCMTQHNGEYGCLFCEEPGQSLRSGMGNCRSYSVRESTKRTKETIESNTNEAHETGKRTKGFFGKSVLSYLPYFDLCEDTVVDYMHGILTGITKKLLELWFNSKHSGSSFYIGNQVKNVDRRLKVIKPPYMIHRFPRPIEDSYNHWKASELRNWLLFYSLPCLENILEDTYFKHFSCLVEATYILLGTGITGCEIERARHLLRNFVSSMEILYGQSKLTLNVHNLTHIVDKVVNWGPLWCWSCFPFESFNGEIKSNIHGTGNVCRQVYWKFQAQRNILQNYQEIKNDDCREYIKNLLQTDRHNLGTEAHQCHVIKPVTVRTDFSENVCHQLLRLCGKNVRSDFLEASKIVHKGYFMYSLGYGRAKVQNSTIISIESHGERKMAMEVRTFLICRENQHVFAIGRLLTCESTPFGYASHLLKMKCLFEEKIMPITQLREPMVCVQENDDIVCALLPNMFERD